MQPSSFIIIRAASQHTDSHKIALEISAAAAPAAAAAAATASLQDIVSDHSMC